MGRLYGRTASGTTTHLQQETDTHLEVFKLENFYGSDKEIVQKIQKPSLQMFYFYSMRGRIALETRVIKM